MSQFLRPDSSAPAPKPMWLSAGPSSGISRLIRSKGSKEFLVADGTWTKDLQKAARFGSQSLAQAAVGTFRLTEVELYYMMGEELSPLFDFTTSL